MVAYGFQTGFTTRLTSRLASADTTATLATVPSVTAGRMLLVNGNITEWISYTGVSGSTITGLTRNLSQTADPATGGTGLDWGAGTQILMVVMHDQYVDKAIALPIVGYTTTARDALDMASDYFTGSYPIIYNSTVGEYQYYTGSAWASFASGTTSDASTTVAGKVEIATTAESIAGTDTGGTGAKLVILPSDTAKNVQSGTFIYGADAGGDDTYVVTLVPALAAYTTGQTLSMKATTANTGACTIDFGPGAKSVKLIDGTDPLDGDIAAGITNDFKYDGTNLVLQQVPSRAVAADITAGTNTLKYVTPSQMVNATQNLHQQNININGGGTINNQVGTCATTGVSTTEPLFVTCSSSTSSSQLLRYIKRPNGDMVCTHQVNLNSTTSREAGVCVVGSYVYASCYTGSVVAVYRYSKDDLTGATLMTISGTALSAGSELLFSNGTDIWAKYTAGTAKKYTISGTTLTSGADTSYTSMTTAGGVWCDGTSVYEFDVSGRSYKWAIAGGARTTGPDNSGLLGQYMVGNGGTIQSGYGGVIFKENGNSTYIHTALFGQGTTYTSGRIIPIATF